MSALLSICLLVGLLALWIARRVADEIVGRLAQRLAAWLLPEDRPTTYRLAWFAARVARWIAPEEEVQLFRQDPRFGTRHLITVQPLEWSDPEAVLAELETDKAGDRITKPVRLVLPVVAQALRYRAASVAGIAVVLPALVFIGPVLVYRHVRWSANRLRRTRTLARISTYGPGIRVYVRRDRVPAHRVDVEADLRYRARMRARRNDPNTERIPTADT
jgi:hypothetical protein